MELLSPELVLVAPPEERERILASLPARDPYAFLQHPPREPAHERQPDPQPRKAGRPVVLQLAAYVLLEVAGVLLFGAIVIAVVLATVAMVEVVAR